jgi:hypothetical protein
MRRLVSCYNEQVFTRLLPELKMNQAMAKANLQEMKEVIRAKLENEIRSEECRCLGCYTAWLL